jgi:hypothetical protein
MMRVQKGFNADFPKSALMQKFTLLKNCQIPLYPPFSKGEKASGFIEFRLITSPPFGKGRPGGISGQAVSIH